MIGLFAAVVATAGLTAGCSTTGGESGSTYSPSSYEADQAARDTAEYRHQTVEPDTTDNPAVEGTPAPDR
ncbi:MAG: hypothetical protein LLG01_07230 [Planctomycetaceae bacterium]|nr:hypothetical protein [Planctomycetaceae bacterium]